MTEYDISVFIVYPYISFIGVLSCFAPSSRNICNFRQLSMLHSVQKLRLFHVMFLNCIIYRESLSLISNAVLRKHYGLIQSFFMRKLISDFWTWLLSVLQVPTLHHMNETTVTIIRFFYNIYDATSFDTSIIT